MRAGDRIRPTVRQRVVWYVDATDRALGREPVVEHALRATCTRSFDREVRRLPRHDYPRWAGLGRTEVDSVLAGVDSGWRTDDDSLGFWWPDLAHALALHHDGWVRAAAVRWLADTRTDGVVLALRATDWVASVQAIAVEGLQRACGDADQRLLQEALPFVATEHFRRRHPALARRVETTVAAQVEHVSPGR